MHFKNQTLIISGGLGDIGRAIALEFGLHGAAIALGDLLPPAQAGKFLEKLRRNKVRCHYAQVDVADAAAVCSWVKQVERDLSVPRIVIANAAIVTLADIHQVTAEQWSRELRVNLDGAFHLTQAATARLLHHRKPGTVLFIGSWAAHRPHHHIPAYCVAKAGLRMLCQCLALALAPRGISVNELAPGIVDGGVSRRVQEQNPALRKRALKKIPVGKLITPREVAQQAIQLCHPQTRHVTGSTLLMDGGLSLLS